MEEKIESRAAPERIWQGWAHMHSGQGSAGKFKYQVIDLVPNERFTMVWRSLFLKLCITYSVVPGPRGSDVGFAVKVRGPLAWAVGWFVRPRVEGNLRDALRQYARNLEE